MNKGVAGEMPWTEPRSSASALLEACLKDSIDGLYEEERITSTGLAR